MTTRRGFLGTLLAAAVAPAIVKADSLMPIFVPKQEIILPKLEIVVGDTTGLNAGAYTASIWVKAKNGEWERIIKTFDVEAGERRKIAIDLPHKDPYVCNMQLMSLTAGRGLPPPSTTIHVTDGGLVYDSMQTPYLPGQRIGTQKFYDERRNKFKRTA